MKHRKHRKHSRQLTLLLGLAGVLQWQPSLAELTSVTDPKKDYKHEIATSARLDFRINMGKFLFFRVGDGAYPAASSTVDTVTFDLGYTVPSSPVDGDSQAYGWAGAAPLLQTVSASNNVLPVEVRSNAGQITLRATVNSPLSNGSQTIPFSDIVVSSSSADLPAPLIPATGTGASVNVTGSSFSGLVTERLADWTFSYVSSSLPEAGSYNGEVLFTASAP